LKTNIIPSAAEIRLKIIELLYKAGASHLGSNMSVIEILISMYSLVDIEKIKQNKNDRSRIIVSKGHCAVATYTILNFYGLLSEEQLNTYHLDDSLLAGHVSHSVPYVEHSTGALGHGLSVALGCALGQKSKNYKESLSLCLCGDGEIQEGSIWEALMFAGHKKLDNLVVFIDYNKISSITNTNDIVNLESLTDKFDSFNFNTTTVDGHNVEEIMSKVKSMVFKKKPVAVICDTIKGKDIPFAENEAIWHYRSLNEELYLEAKEHLKKII
jgi:transketolase